MASPAHRLAPGVSWIDLHFQGRPERIAAALLHGRAGTAIVDPGPSSCLPHLEQSMAGMGIGFDAVTHLLITHIHLDHAGAVGSIVRQHPHIRVVVHRRGAPHMVDPSKLLDSAGRLYGAEMDRLWGRCEPVPQAALVVVDGEETLAVAGRSLAVAYTPGHASHHVSFFDRDSGVAWVGDTGGICVGGGYVLPPTPPPDIDLELWRTSVSRIEEWGADSLFLTHCGPAGNPRVHLRSLAENLEMVAGWARDSLLAIGSGSEQHAAFDERVRRELRRSMSEERVAAYESAAGFGLQWLGLARYWRKRGIGGD